MLESFRIAGRYIMDMGDGMSVQISGHVLEDLEYETSIRLSLALFHPDERGWIWHSL